MLTLDHIAIGCAALDDGAAWVEGFFGVPMQPGGQHLRYGTHNRLLGMGDIYLEVIARDPSLNVDGPVWFDLGGFAGPPRPANWICRTPDFENLPAPVGAPRALERGDLKWQITVPDDGSLPWAGAYPTLLKWAEGATPPAQSLPDSHVRLLEWRVRHPEADALRDMIKIDDPRVVFEVGSAALEATFHTPRGVVTLK